jgi:hypothetical protein
LLPRGIVGLFARREQAIAPEPVPAQAASQAEPREATG